MDAKYFYSFIAYVLSFMYIAFELMQTGSVALFTVFIFLAIYALASSNWFVSAIVYAYLLSNLISYFLASQTVVLFLLIILLVIGFMLSVSPCGYRPRMNLEEERRKNEEEFNRLQTFEQATRKVAKKAAKKKSKKKAKK